MECILEDFVGKFTDAIDDDLNFKFLKWFDSISKNNITASSFEDTGGTLSSTLRKDEVVQIPSGLSMNCFPQDICKPLWESIFECYKIYNAEYSLDIEVTSQSFKAHRTRPRGGYHIWHQEHSSISPLRVLVWMLMLEAPEKGGETEFLNQSMRVTPVPNQLLIWPAGFTHKHRGNPPLLGQKTYLTGWFEHAK
tara:strand:+ start:382 stop:963 length:582 start_codon:yes stop_codon:yes gene_type:complete